MKATVRNCPACSDELPVVEGYVTWCHSCGWNVTAPERHTPQSRLDRLYAKAGQRLGERMISRLLTAKQLQPRLTPTRMAAYAVAFGVHALTGLFLVGGAALGVLAFPNIAAIVGAVLMIGAGFMMRPRLGKPPTEGVIERSDAPQLHVFVDQVAAALEMPSVDLIAVDHEFNASWAIVGVRRRSVLTLGLPLLTVFEPQERVALIAHELAHGRNGDSSRGLFVGSAVGALAELYWLLSPEEEAGGAWELGLFEQIANVVLYGISRPLYWLLMLELHLLLRDSQRAEYLADVLAARVAGRDAQIAIDEKLLLESIFRSSVRDAARRGVGEDHDLFAELLQRFAHVPERERERRRRVARLETARLSATHPPTSLRIRLVESLPPAEPMVVLDPDRAAAIDSELTRYRRTLQRTLVDRHRDRLYDG